MQGIFHRAQLAVRSEINHVFGTWLTTNRLFCRSEEEWAVAGAQPLPPAYMFHKSVSHVLLSSMFTSHSCLIKLFVDNS